MDRKTVDRKQTAIQDFTQSLIKASIVSVEQARQYLELQIARNQVKSIPTCEVFYDYPTLFNLNQDVLKQKYPQLIGLTKDQALPKSVGDAKLNPITTLNNKRYYITPIIRKTEELGFSKIYIDQTGVIFYLKRSDLGPLAEAYFSLAEEIVSMCKLSLDQVKERLETLIDLQNCTPTHGAFLSYVKLLSGKTKYPELLRLSPDAQSLPKNIGPYQLNLEVIFTNELHFISKIVRQSKEAGFEGANVGQHGITYYIPPEFLGPKAKQLYRCFFLTKEEVDMKVREQKNLKTYKEENMVVITYCKFYSNTQVQRVNYELRKHYNRMGFSVSLSYDWRYEKDDEQLILKIFIDPDDYE